MRKHIFIFSLFIVQSYSYSQDTLAFYPTKDTYINTVIADKIQADTRSFIASTWTYSGTKGFGHSLLGFELCRLPEDFKLLKANLYLFYDNESGHAGHSTGGLNTAKLYKITSPWTENTTWASKPTYDEEKFANLPASTTSSQDYKVDVTAIVSSELNESTEVGFYFKLNNESIYRSLVFASSNHPNPEFHPRLEIIYESPHAWCDLDAIQKELDNCLIHLNIPNVFTPNKDDINDFFRIDSIGCSYDSFSIEVVNRWGKLVYESESPIFKWYGINQYNLDPVTNGTYFYSIKVKRGGLSAYRMGTITVLR